MATKIALVCDSYAPAWGYGGPPRLVTTLASELHDLGHRVSVVTTDVLDTRRHRQSECAGPTIYRAKTLCNKLAWESKIFLPIPTPAMIRAIGNADVVHLFQGRSVLSALGYLSGTLNGKPIILSPLGGLPVVGGGDTMIKKAYDWIFFSRIKNGFDAVLCQNSHEISTCREWGFSEEKVHLVPLCVDLDEFDNLPETGRFRNRHPELKDSKHIYIYVGRIHRYKGLDMLIRAFAEAFPEGENMLVIAGKDEKNVAELKALADSLGCAHSILFLGPIYGKEKAEAFVDSSAFVITPTIYEETSLAALEAAACHLPVITTEKSETPLLGDYNAGITAESNVADIVRSLRQISGMNTEERARMGVQARAMIEQCFSPEAVARELMEIYSSVANAKHH